MLAMCLFYIQIEKIPTEQIKTALRGKYKATGPCEGVNKLNERQMKFANEYLIDLNAEQAAIHRNMRGETLTSWLQMIAFLNTFKKE